MNVYFLCSQTCPVIGVANLEKDSKRDLSKHVLEDIKAVSDDLSDGS